MLYTFVSNYNSMEEIKNFYNEKIVDNIVSIYYFKSTNKHKILCSFNSGSGLFCESKAFLFVVDCNYFSLTSWMKVSDFVSSYNPLINEV